MTRVGFVGLGKMGSRMAHRLLENGYQLRVWNRSREVARTFAQQGAHICASPKELAGCSEVVITMLADDAASEAVHNGELGLLAADGGCSIFLAMGTLSPDHIHKLHAQAAFLGKRLTDLPVSGSIDAAENGTLMLMAGATETEMADTQAILRVLSNKVFYMGKPGMGATMKLVVNQMVHGINQNFAEAMLLAEHSGIDTVDAYEVIADSAACAPMLKYRRGQYLDESSSPVSFALRLAEKDMTLVLHLAEQKNLHLPLANLTREYLQKAGNAGYGKRDMSSLLPFIRESVMSGISIPEKKT